MVEKDPYIEEALKELEKLSKDPKKREEYNARDKAIRDYIAFMTAAREDGYEESCEAGREEGWKSGQEEGRKQQLQETIQKMLEKKQEYDFISEVTGADIAYIKALAEKRER